MVGVVWSSVTLRTKPNCRYEAQGKLLGIIRVPIDLVKAMLTMLLQVVPVLISNAFAGNGPSVSFPTIGYVDTTGTTKLTGAWQVTLPLLALLLLSSFASLSSFAVAINKVQQHSTDSLSSGLDKAINGGPIHGNLSMR